MSKLYYGEIVSPVGPLLIISDGEAIVRIDYGTMDTLEDKLKKWGRRYFDDPVFVKEPEQVQQVKNELVAYSHKEHQHYTFSFTFHETPFQKQVWQALYEII